MVIERMPLRKPVVPGHNATFYCLWITSGGQYASSPLTRELYGYERWHVYKVTCYMEEPWAGCFLVYFHVVDYEKRE